MDRIKILEKGGVKVAFIGLATDEIYYQSYLEPHKMLDPIKSAKIIVNRVKEKYRPDLIIAITHLGVLRDTVLAEEVPGIDLIIGGHSHTLLLEPKYALNKITKKMIPIVQVGEYGQYLGETILTFNDKLKTVRLKKYTVYPVSPEIVADPKMEELANLAYTESFKYLNPKLTKSHIADDINTNSLPAWEINGKIDGNLVIAKPIKKVAYGPSNFGNLVVDAFRYVLNADFAFYDTNTMGLTLPQNKNLLISDLYNALPFIYNFESKRSWNVYLLKMSVAQLRMLLMAGLMFSENIAVSGKTLTYNPNGIIVPSVNLSSYNGTELSDDFPITVATTEAFLMALKISKKYVGDMDIKVYDTGYEAWDLLGFYLQNRNENALIEANKVRHRLIQKNKDILPLVCDINQDLDALKNKKIRFTLPLENISRKKIKKGFKVKVYQSPHIGYQSKVDSYSSYKLVFSQTVDLDLKSKSRLEIPIEIDQINEEQIEQSRYDFIPTRKYYVEVETNDEVSEKNLLNNFQEFELREF
ncbi:MAG: 5'-nucleotidase C-terminal domain-containing protein [Bacteriovoracaceae bacterium]